MNERVLDGLNGLAANVAVLGNGASFVARYGIYALGLLALGLGLRVLAHDRPKGLMIATATLGAALLAGGFVLIGSHVVVEMRPFVADADTVPLFPHATDNAFPSDHATLAAVMATIGARAWPRWSAAFVGMALGVGLGRVMAGVHYPGDVLAGWTIGCLSALLTWYIVARATDASRDGRRSTSSPA